MTCKFKMAGALMAVVAMFALTASSASATFTSSVSPNTGTATSTADKLDLFGSTVECTNNTFHVGKFNSTSSPGVHEPAPFPTETLTALPTYKNCTAFGLPSTVDFKTCDLVLHHSGGVHTVDLACPEGVKGVEITTYSSSAHTTALCHVVVTPFANKGGLTASNSGSHVLIKGTLEGIAAHQERTNFLCPPGTETNAAKYTVQAAGITLIPKEGSASVS